MKKKCTNAILLLLIVSAFFALVCVKIQAASKPTTFYKYYTKKTKLTVRSSTGYRKIQLNGKKIAMKKGSKAYVVKVVKPGKNVIKTVDVTGEKCNIIAYIDKRCPTFNFTDGETYCNELTVTAYDDVKLSSVTLNGKKAGKSFTITEKGDYKVVAKDAAGNKTVSSFSLIRDDLSKLRESWDVSVAGDEVVLMAYKGTEGEVTVPAGCYVDGKECPVRISETRKSGKSVFSGNASVTSITFEDGVIFPTNMDDMFAGCTGLKEVKGLSGKYTSADRMFYGCSELDCDLRLPATLKSAESMFEGCSSMKNVPLLSGNKYEDLTAMFKGCKTVNTDRIVIPCAKVTEMFADCVSLDPQSIELAEGITDLSEMFSGCSSLRNIQEIPDSVEHADETFKGCTELTNVPSFSDSGIVNARYMFQNCSSLEELPETLPETLVDMTGMFEGCKNVSGEVSVPVPDRVTNMSRSFYGCSKLERFPTISTSSELEDASYMFYDCSSLSIGSMQIPGNVKHISYMFYGCTSLGKKFGSSAAKIYSDVDTSKLEDADCVFSLSGYEKQSEFLLYLKKINTYKLNGQTVTDDMLYWSRLVPDNCEICLK